MRIVIKGVPIPQQRHRHRLLTTGNVMTYDPLAREKAIIKHTMQAIVKKDHPNFVPFKIPDVEFRFYMPIPRYLKKAEREYAKKDLLRHIVKPDVDNLVKLYLDCLVNIVFEDDRSVKITGAQKIYSLEPRAEILITEGSCILGEDTPQHEKDELLISGELKTSTIDVPPYSKCPRYSDIPQLHDSLNLSRNKAGP